VLPRRCNSGRSESSQYVPFSNTEEVVRREPANDFTDTAQEQQLTAKIHYNTFLVASLQQVRNINSNKTEKNIKNYVALVP